MTNSTLYIELKKQHELAKIEEIDLAIMLSKACPERSEGSKHGGQSFSPFTALTSARQSPARPAGGGSGGGLNGVNVMDAARPAARKSNPRRSTVVLITLFLSAVAGRGYVLIVNRYGQYLDKVVRIFDKKRETRLGGRKGGR